DRISQSGGEKMGKVFNSDTAADADQSALIQKLKRTKTADDLAWHTIKLNMGQPTDSGWTIEVCSPVFLDGYYVPVTAVDAWDLAKHFEAFPLTRAVADQPHNHVLDKSGSDYAISYIPIDSLPLPPVYKAQGKARISLKEYQYYWDSPFLSTTKYMTDPSIH